MLIILNSDSCVKQIYQKNVCERKCDKCVMCLSGDGGDGVRTYDMFEFYTFFTCPIILKFLIATTLFLYQQIN